MLHHSFPKRTNEAECLFSFNVRTDAPRGATAEAKPSQTSIVFSLHFSKDYVAGALPVFGVLRNSIPKGRKTDSIVVWRLGNEWTTETCKATALSIVLG
jgi:hypothetical protein